MMRMNAAQSAGRQATPPSHHGVRLGDFGVARVSPARSYNAPRGPCQCTFKVLGPFLFFSNDP